MQISTPKTKCLVVNRNHLTCNINLHGSLIEQVPKFNYLGTEISSNRDLNLEVKQHILKGTRIAGCLNNVIWKNKHMSVDSKTKIYKTCVRPVFTYGIEARADTTVTQQLLQTAEMRVIRAIQGKTLLDKIRNEDLRATCGIQDIVSWVRVRRREWAAHVERMDEDRLPKIVTRNRPDGRRSRGRPKKRWSQS